MKLGRGWACRIPVRISSYNPGISAVLSTLVPGLGQIFQGRIGFGFGIMILVGILVVLGIWGSLFMLIPAFLMYVGFVYEAYNYRTD